MNFVLFSLLVLSPGYVAATKSDEIAAEVEHLLRSADKAADEACKYTSTLPHPMAIFAGIQLPQNAPFRFESSSKLANEFRVTTAVQPLPQDRTQRCESINMVASNISSYLALLQPEDYLAQMITSVNNNLQATLADQGYQMPESHLRPFPTSLLETLEILHSALEQLLIDFTPAEAVRRFSVPKNFTTLEDFVEAMYVVTLSMCTFLKSFSQEIRTNSRMIGSEMCHISNSDSP